MHIEPTYTSVGSLFHYRPMFFIPKYQRAYAWDSESISDFIKDLKNCFDKRQSNSPINHFFGGVLSVKHYVSGAVNQHEYEIIDGQQRIATFILLISRIIKNYEKLLLDAKKSDNSNNISIIEKRIELLKPRFIKFEQEIQRKITYVEVLRLSKADHSFYKELIQDVNPSPSRDSHQRIWQADQSLDKAIKEIINNFNTLEDKIDALEIIQNILDNDFTILHMVTESRAPTCLDKSRVYDFAGTSIEHVYPRNADTANKDLDIEPLKNTLGNLTIMDPAQNTIGGNDNFIQKRSLYQNSSVILTKEIGEKTIWTKNEIENHQNLLINAAMTIFRP
jgi:hypothetical protein